MRHKLSQRPVAGTDPDAHLWAVRCEGRGGPIGAGPLAQSRPPGGAAGPAAYRRADLAAGGRVERVRACAIQRGAGVSLLASAGFTTGGDSTQAVGRNRFPLLL